MVCSRHPFIRLWLYMSHISFTVSGLPWINTVSGLVIAFAAAIARPTSEISIIISLVLSQNQVGSTTACNLCKKFVSIRE
jgi:hypothetical protein